MDKYMKRQFALFFLCLFFEPVWTAFSFGIFSKEVAVTVMVLALVPFMWAILNLLLLVENVLGIVLKEYFGFVRDEWSDNI